MPPVHAARTGLSRFFNREVSWLAFNRRVLEEAEDRRNPILERTKFMAIVSSNFDEFVMVRYAELRAISRGEEEARGYLGDPIADLVQVRASMRTLVEDQYRCWRDDLRPALSAAGARILSPSEWSDTDREAMRRLYVDRFEPVLTPLAVDPTRPFPLLANRGLHVAVELRSAKDRSARNAMVSVPAGQRLIALPSGVGQWALAEDVVAGHIGSLFPGYAAEATCLFRVTRDGTLDIDEESASDLLSEIEQELSSREHGAPVRLELREDGESRLASWLQQAMHLEQGDVQVIAGPLDLTVLHGFSERLAGAEFRDPPLSQVMTPPPDQWEDPFARIREGDILLHHPYQSFQPLVEFVTKSAADPRVLAIKQTLYRVSGDSPIVKALIEAARAGKQVTVLIELKARFDEGNNIRWAKRLEEAGAHVIYGLVGYKVHAKMLMVIRRDQDGIRRYVHLGTGNYNDRTAKLYTDLSYFTANEAVGRDVSGLFNMLTGYSEPPDWERLEVAPLTMRQSFSAWIRQEADLAKAGKGGRIIAKFNSLVDPALCEELYAASQAGVQIDLIVRGMCILRPGVPGLSETIRVRSLVGRFLEHHRIYYFANRDGSGGRPVVAIASADWMTRNLDRRVECLVRIEDEELQARLLGLLDLALADNVQARILDGEGVYRRLYPPKGETGRSTVRTWAEEAATQGVSPRQRRGGTRFKPQKAR